jgi:hypothetical protein
VLPQQTLCLLQAMHKLSFSARTSFGQSRRNTISAHLGAIGARKRPITLDFSLLAQHASEHARWSGCMPRSSVVVARYTCREVRGHVNLLLQYSIKPRFVVRGVVDPKQLVLTLLTDLKSGGCDESKAHQLHLDCRGRIADQPHQPTPRQVMNPRGKTSAD